MKIKSHSGTKKRVRARKNKLMMQKACKNHLLSNKSKRQKNAFTCGYEVDSTNLKKVKKLLPHGAGK